jgi:hypothetical protein
MSIGPHHPPIAHFVNFPSELKEGPKKVDNERVVCQKLTTSDSNNSHINIEITTPNVHFCSIIL